MADRLRLAAGDRVLAVETERPQQRWHDEPATDLATMLAAAAGRRTEAELAERVRRHLSKLG
jgi:hypothetical protein